MSGRSLLSLALLLGATVLSSNRANAEDADSNGTIVVDGVRPDLSVRDASQTAVAGPLGNVSIHDLPATVNVVPQNLAQLQQLKSVQDMMRYIPSVQGDGFRPQSRGFQGSVVQNSRLDGLNIVSTTDYPAEQFDRIDVLNGLAGAIYGPANPAGIFSYTSKRPSDRQQLYARVGFGSGDLWLEHLDATTPLAGGAVGARVNLLNEAGEGYLDGSHISRQFASGAFDAHLGASTSLEANISYYRFVALGTQPSFATASGVRFPSEIDPNKTGYAQPYAGQVNHTYTGSLRLKHDFGGDWHLTLGVLDQIADRNLTQLTDTITNNAGAYTATIATATASRFTILSNIGYLNGAFDTGPLHHQLAIGTNGFTWRSLNPVAGSTLTLGSANLATPVAFARPALPDFSDRYLSSVAWQQVLVASDRISWGPRWSVLLTGSQSWLSVKNNNVKGQRTSQSSNSGFSPSVSIIYQPTKKLMGYVTYASSLQQGDTAPVGTSNANQILSPYRSTEWEGGVKVALSAMDITLAGFQIERPFAFIQPGSTVFAQAGTQRNRGVELMANGALAPGLSFYGGVSYLNPKLLNTGNALTSDTRIVGLSRWTMSSLLTWQVPRVSGLAVTAFVRHVSNRPSDNQNRFYVPGYTTLDLGLNKTIDWNNRQFALRLNVMNVTDERYLTNIIPGGLNGYTGAGNAAASLGQPRSIQASVAVKL